ncbi:hypothetical protein EGW08_017023 [Elysia chlorotica]|uniref:Cytochrome b561 domain-containing protein n=1 Tax=Elysia chlorotica TaxID=188477 RepID=A0A3S1B546_ELYCH|nr:hypothetical protein EGW08_017023 [Elysia chlorotica]
MHSLYLDSNMASSADMRYFNWVVLLVQLLGVVSVVITAVWMGHFSQGGFAWTEDPAKEFSYHPLFMVIGLIFLYGDGILAYRVFRNDRKFYIKILHGGMHVAALIFASVGLKAVFDSHNLADPPLANLYSLHSWLGLLVVIGFGLQWVLGFACFLLPWLGMSIRTMYMPYHTFWGVTLLILATATALMGITEKAIFSMAKNGYTSHSREGTLINCLGLILVIFTGLVVYLVTKPEYKRQPAPDEEHVPLDN